MDESARLAALQLKVADLERKLNFVLDQLHLEYTAEPLNPALSAAADLLVDLVRLRSGKLADDVSIVLVRESIASAGPS